MKTSVREKAKTFLLFCSALILFYALVEGGMYLIHRFTSF